MADYFDYLRYWERWEASKERAGGGHLLWLGVHFLDMSNFITGSVVVEATGTKQ